MKIKKINIVCHSHYNMNGTDHQAVVTAVNKQIIDKALELIDRYKDNRVGERFCWTAEAAVPLLEWWAEAAPERRRQLIESVENGYFEVCAFPYNISSAISESEVNKVVNWIPADIFNVMNVRTAIQSGVDGVSAAAINKFTSKGIRFVWVMPSRNGNFLRKYPFAFNWKITSTGRVLAFQGGSVGNFSELMLGVPSVERYIKTSDTAYGFSKKGDMLPSVSDDGDEAKRFVAEAYVKIANYIEDVDKNGDYPFSVLPVSYIGNLRGGNEPPCEDIVEFVKLWNSMDLKPKLAITTAADAFAEMKVESDALQIPTFSGQWQDTFSRDLMSAPKEMSLTRDTVRLYKQIRNLSEPRVPGDERTAELVMRDACSLYEHNISAYDLKKQCDDLTVRSSETAKFAPVYRGYARAEYLLAEKVRKNIEYDKEGIYVYNPSPCDCYGPVTVPSDTLKGDYISVMENDTLAIKSLKFSSVKKTSGEKASFWADVPAQSSRSYSLMELATPEKYEAESPSMELDGNGWPLKIRYADGKTVNTFVLGDVEAVIPKGGRRACDMLNKVKDADRENLLDNILTVEEFSYSLSLTAENENCITVTQEFMSSVGNGKRVMTVYKQEPRVNVTVTIDRLPGLEPAAIYAKFSLDTGNSFPVTSCGGLVFDPTRSVLNGCSHDIIQIDSWVSYPYAKLVLFSKDTPFISFGGNNYRANSKTFSENKGIICPLLFDNTSPSNTVADSYGTFTYSFDLVAEDSADDFEKLNKLAEKCFAKPIPVVHIR